VTSWRASLRLSKAARAQYNATHDALREHVELRRQQARQYEDEINLVPESRFEGDQIALGFEPSKQDRRRDSFRETFQ
jgi:hypothetical protein